MEEIREQPDYESQENLGKDLSGSQIDSLGKFKSVQALMDAYENLQSEFTKKCQLLSEIQKDKTAQAEENQNNELAGEDKPQEENNGFNQEAFAQFLEENSEANSYREEIEKHFDSATQKTKSPYEVAWASILLNRIREGDKISDPIINQYVLSDENVKNKIIENYIHQLNNARPPITISSHAGERVVSAPAERPKTLADAKKLVDKMFS